MYRGNLQNTGVYDTQQPAFHRPEPNWVFTAQDPVTVPPVIHDGVVYFGTSRGCLHAVELRPDGAGSFREKWVHNTEVLSTFRPVSVGDGKVFVTLYLYVCAIDAELGNDSSSFRGRANILSPPTFHDGAVFVGARNLCIARFTERRRSVNRWTFRWDGEIFHNTPLVYDGSVFFVSMTGSVVSLDISNGAELWRRPSSDPSGYYPREPVISDGTLYITWIAQGASNERTCRVLAIDTSDGHSLWTRTLTGTFPTGLAIDDSVVFYGSSDGNLYAIDLGSWNTRWRIPTGGAIYHAPSIVGNNIYFGNDLGMFYAVDKTTGDVIGQIETVDNAPVSTEPAIFNGRVYFGDVGGNFYEWGSPRLLEGILQVGRA